MIFLTILDSFLQIMRQRRIDRGALTLASPEVKFEIDTETHDPLDVGESPPPPLVDICSMVYCIQEKVLSALDV